MMLSHTIGDKVEAARVAVTRSKGGVVTSA